MVHGPWSRRREEGASRKGGGGGEGEEGRGVAGYLHYELVTGYSLLLALCTPYELRSKWREREEET